MYLGKVMELANRNALFREPLHPYTQSLVSAVPVPMPKRERQRRRFILKGDPPSPSNPPSGCVFHTRCPLAEEVCVTKVPEFREIQPGHYVACHLTGTETGSKIPEKTVLASELT
jgi:oligopeptide/dipeptide ABC transporter ATP-binding protein